MKPHRLLLLAGGLALAGTSCFLPNASVEPRYGRFELDGELAIADSTLGITASNSLDDLGLQDDSGVPGIRGDVKWGSPHLTVMWQSSSHDGSGQLTADLSDGDVTIPVGTAVDSALDLGLGEALLTFDLFPGDTFEVGIGLGAVLLDIDASFTGGGETIDADQALPLPVLAARGGVQFGKLDAQAVLSGFDASYDGDDVRFLDLDLFLRYSLFGGADGTHGALILGWRRLDLDAEYDDSGESVHADAVFDGPYVGFSLGV